MNLPIIVIDVGNTQTSLGLFRGLRRLSRIDVPTHNTALPDAVNAIRSLVGNVKPVGATLATVVPAKRSLWLEALKEGSSIVRVVDVNYKVALGIPVTYPRPETIGADRLANACAAAYLFGAPVIVADFGTAVTFDVVTPTEGYIGGVIAPGVGLMFDYLAEKTALLPALRPGKVSGWIGRSTEQAMRLGAEWGYRGLVKEVLMQLKKNRRLRRARICATGGYARWVLRGLGWKIPVDPDLTLKGLVRIYELNAAQENAN